MGLVIASAACGRSRFDVLDDGPGAGDAATTGDALEDSTPSDDANRSTTLVAAVTTLGNGTPPSARRATGAAVADDNRVWVFGGFVGGVGAQSDLYAYTPGSASWQLLTTTGSPPTARERHTLAWNSADSVLVLFSGYSATLTHLNELLFYLPTSSSWTPIPVSGTWPTARKDAAMVWLPSQNQMLLYGGNDGSGAANRSNELWLLSINVATPSATWTLLTPGGATPPKQSAPCIGYDPVARRLLLFGGQTQDNVSVATTYQYLVTTNVWQQDTPTGNVPSARSFSNCVWDPVASRLVLYGGQDTGGTPIAGTYAYDPDGKRWDVLAPAMGSATPSNCGDAGAAYSTSLGAMFLFGGRTGASSYTNETRVIDLIYE
jgi:hypothetical protein